ncbi:MAG: hypothetical protein K1X57_13835 [Gemmataceae bacterium]|nr:hypothetical protein [Gemmataceae bacterium]
MLNHSPILTRSILLVVLLSTARGSQASGHQNAIPPDQKTPLKVYPPSADQQSKPGTGKFVIFTREPVGKSSEYVAGAWECIPSEPDRPITKRVDFCHSSWSASPLLSGLVADDSKGRCPRFVRLQVNSDDRTYTVKIYDIDYRTWDVRCVWQGKQFQGFGTLGRSIICSTSDGWIRIDAETGALSKDVPFEPLWTDGDFWVVSKPNDSSSIWSYHRTTGEYVARFAAFDRRQWASFRRSLSTDGKSLAWALISWSDFGKWTNRTDDGKRRGGLVDGRLVLQRMHVKDDLILPFQVWAEPSSAFGISPKIHQLEFVTNSEIQIRRSVDDRKLSHNLWTVDVTTGHSTTSIVKHEDVQEDCSMIGRVPVPDYLRAGVNKVRYFGRGELAVAFMMHKGIIADWPQFDECTGGVSNDGRHVLFHAKKGPLAGHLYYGNLATRQVIRWQLPPALANSAIDEFAWVETP